MVVGLDFLTFKKRVFGALEMEGKVVFPLIGTMIFLRLKVF